MDAVAFSDKKVIEAAEPFVRVLVDATQPDPRVRTLLRRFGVRGYPSVQVREPGGEQVGKTFHTVNARKAEAWLLDHAPKPASRRGRWF